MFRGTRLSHLTLMLSIAACIAVTGCKDDVVDTLNNAKQQIIEPEPEPEPVAQGPTGFIKLTLEGMVETNGCYVSFFSFASGRPSVLRIASYPDSDQEAFPSVMLQAQVDVDSAAALAGTSVQADAYVMVAQGAPAWHSNPGTLEVKITSITGNKVVGEIVGGELRNPVTDSTTAVTGTFDGTL